MNRPGSPEFTFNFFHLTGDSDHDRDVDNADFLVLYRNFGKAGDFSMGDVDYNGVVDFRDFQRLERVFGRTLPAAAVGEVGMDEFAVVTVAPARPVAAKPVFAVKPAARRGV